MSFANLKRNSGNIEELSKALTSLQKAQPEDTSETFWKLEVDKAGNGAATIRFLPAPGADGDDALPWVKVFSHTFQGPGGWVYDNCLTTKNQECPVCEHNKVLWNSGIEDNKKLVSKQKRKLTYISNIYIVSDPKHPENNGKVMLFKYGKKIFDKINEAMHPQFDDEKPINPFDLWKGANFKLKAVKEDGYQNYNKSTFDAPTALSDNDEELEKIYNQELSLKQFIADDQFKSFDELKKRLDKALGLNGIAPKTTVETIRENVKKSPEVSMAADEDEDDMAYFAKLAED